MSTSTTPVRRHGHIAPVPIYPLHFNPFYHPTICSSYIPLSYGTTTRLIPISEGPYSQVLLNNQLSHEPTHISSAMSSTSLNHFPKMKKPVHVYTHIPPNNQGEIQKYENGIETFEKSEEIPTDVKKISNQNHSNGFDYNLPIVNPVNNNHEKYEENEKPDLPRDGKILNDNMNNYSNIMTTEPIQTNQSLEAQHQLSSTTLIKLDTSTPTDSINFPEIYKTSIPTTKSEILYSPEIFSNSVSQLPLGTNYPSSDELLTKRTQFISQLSSLQESHFLSTNKHPGTTIDTKLVITKNDVPEKTSSTDDKNQLNEPRNAQPHLQTLNVKDTIKILESSTQSKVKSAEITETTLNPETMFSTSQHLTTALFSTSRCENNDCSSISSHETIPSIKATFQADSFNKSVKAKSVLSTTINNEYNNRSDFIISSIHPLPTATTTSELLKIPYENPKLPIIVPSSSSSSPEIFTLLSNSILNFDKNNEIQSTNSLNTSLFPELQHSNSNTIMTSMLIENKTEQTPIITINYDNYTTNSKQNTNNPTYNGKTITISSTSTATPILSNVTQKIIHNAVRTSRNNFTLGTNISSKSYQNQEHLITEKVNMYTINKTNNNVPSILTETITELTPSITMSYDNYSKDIEQNTNILLYNDKPTILLSTTATSIQSVSTQNTITQNNVETVKTNLPYDTNTSNSYPSQIYSTTEKTTIYSENKTIDNFPHTTKEKTRNSLRSIVTSIKPRNNIQKKPQLIGVSNDLKYRKSSDNRDRYMAKTETPKTYKNAELWYNDMYTQSPYKKELNEKQIDYLLKKIIKLLKPEIEKQIVTNENTSKLVTPKLGDQEKIVNIILPENIILPMYFTDAAKNIKNEERLQSNKNPLKTPDKL